MLTELLRNCRHVLAWCVFVCCLCLLQRNRVVAEGIRYPLEVRDCKGGATSGTFCQLQGSDSTFCQLQGSDSTFCQLQGSDSTFCQLQGSDSSSCCIMYHIDAAVLQN